jgi:DNA-binding CsgD family transcriptional regulator
MTTRSEPTDSATDPTGPAETVVEPVRFTDATLDDLTGRERDVLELITNGYTNSEVGRLLFLSLNSVKTYVRSAYRKIGAETRSQAVVWGVRHGLLAEYDPPGGPGDHPDGLTREN